MFEHGDTVVFGDVHEDWPRVGEICRKYSTAARRICLGDWFDDWTRTPESTRCTAEVLKEFVAGEGNVSLWGNHDLQYMYPKNTQLMCSGFSWKSFITIGQVIGKADWDRFRFVEWVDTQQGPILLSHAGVHKQFCTPVGFGLEVLSKAKFERLARDAKSACELGVDTEFIGCGRKRGGRHEHGGVTWMDWGEFVPIEGYRQIVGHTKGREWRQRDENWCIDDRLRSVAVIKQAGSVEIERV